MPGGEADVLFDYPEDPRDAANTDLSSETDEENASTTIDTRVEGARLPKENNTTTRGIYVQQDVLIHHSTWFRERPQVRESNQRVDLDALMVIVQNAMYFFYKGRLNLPESDCAQEDDGDESRDLLSYVPHMDPRSARLGLLVVGELDRTTEEEQILQDIPWCQRGFILPGEFTRDCKLTHSVLSLSDPTEAAEYLNLYSINRQVIDEYSFCAKYHDHSNRVGAPGPREFKRCFNGDIVLLEEFNARKVDY